jgi:hypothetical protein
MSLLVVTPTLGRSGWLGETVDSVSSHAANARHVLVAPEAEVAELVVRFPQCEVVVDPGGGMYAAINAGLDAVRDWRAFTYINDDDLLLPAFAGIMAGVARAREESAMIYGRVRLIDGEGRRLGSVPVSRIPFQNRALYAERLEPVYQHGTVVTRKAWEEVGGFDARLRFCGDSDYLARLCVARVRCEFVGGEVAAFRLRPGQLTQNRLAMEAERDRVDVTLGLRVGVSRAARLRARVSFRFANAVVYAERLARHGWRRMDEVIINAGQR